MSLQDCLTRVRKTIERACRNRESQEVEVLIAVKGRPLARIMEALESGIRTLGENRLKEAREHRTFFEHYPGVSWHYIGKIHSRYARKIVEMFSLAQSVEDLEQARALDRAAASCGSDFRILIEVNIGNEATKQGVGPDAVIDLAKAILSECPHLWLDGLSVMPPETEDPETSRPHFAHARTLFEDIKYLRQERIVPRWLSMGTSQDYRVAVEEGSTMVRLGRILFEEAMNNEARIP